MFRPDSCRAVLEERNSKLFIGECRQLFSSSSSSSNEIRVCEFCHLALQQEFETFPWFSFRQKHIKNKSKELLKRGLWINDMLHSHWHWNFHQTRFQAKHSLMFFSSQAPVKTNQEIYENSMLEDDPNANTQLKRESVDPRWGPKHKGAQILANFYSTGESLL